MKEMLAVKDIEPNNGQIPGLPRNPRSIRGDRFEKLKASITGFPEMLELREVIVFPFKKTHVAIAGNMRLLACIELGHKDIPVKKLPAGFPVEKLREIAIKDNAQFGDDDTDILANEWTDFPLEDWGMELAGIDAFTPNLDPEMSHRSVSAEDIVKTKADLEEHFKDKADQYKEVICPHCATEFFIKTE